MGQSRLSVVLPRSQATALFSKLEAEFDEDGLPLGLRELDETAAIAEVSVYVDQASVAEVEARIRNAAGSARLDIACEGLPDVDWVARSLEGLQPVRAGRFLVHGSHDRHRRRAGDLAVEIEAGQAFGTGHHGTTAGCLEMLSAIARRERPRNALDLGTGSAVLAIALARLLRVPVLATDIDPVAVRVARENVRLNGAGPWVKAVTATGFGHPEVNGRAPFDLIVANILARPLMKLAPAMAAHLVAGGSVVLSGILERQREAVLAAYVGQRFRHLRSLHREGWVTLHLGR